MDTDIIPHHISEKNLENLTIRTDLDDVDYDIELTPSQVFGDSDDVVLGSIGAVAIDETGRVYLADTQALQISVFEPNGRFVQTIGREGQGPGEFGAISKLIVDADYLYAHDGRQQRVVQFSLESLAYTRTINLADNRDQFEEIRESLLGPVYMTKSGNILQRFSKSLIPEDVEAWDEIEIHSQFYLLDQEGNIASDELLSRRSSIEVMMQNGPLMVGFPFPFYSRLLFDYDSVTDRMVAAWSEDFLLKVYNERGEYLQALYLPVEKSPLTAQSAFEDTNELSRAFIQNKELPDSWPVLRSMLIDDQGRVWVASRKARSFDKDTATASIASDTSTSNGDSIDGEHVDWWILDRDGELLTRFEWPQDRSIQQIKDGSLYAREMDEETGIQSVVRYDITLN